MKSYTNNPDSSLWKELDLQHGDTLSYIMEHEDSEHWWLAEDKKEQAGYVPVTYPMITIDERVQEEGCDKTRKEGQEKSADGPRLEGR